MRSDFLILKGSFRTIFLINTIRRYFPKSKIILIDKNKKCAAKKYSDIFLNIDAEDFKTIKKKILKFDIFVCLTRSSGQTGLIASKINNFIGFGNTNIKIISKFFSGYQLVNFCKINRLSYIKTLFINYSYNISSPIVIKADIEKIGKKNVFYIKSKEMFAKFFKITKKLSLNNKVLAQDYIDGSDITLLGYVDNNEKFLLRRAYKEMNSFKKSGAIDHKGFIAFKFSKNNKRYKEINKIINKIIIESKLSLIPINFNFRLAKNNKSYLNEINFFFGGENLIENDFDFISDYLKFLRFKSKLI